MAETTGATNPGNKPNTRRRRQRKPSTASGISTQHGDGLTGSSSVDGDASDVPNGGKLYYRIGEVSRITGIKPYVLRYWESEFRWMTPQKSRSKQRLYRRKDIEMIQLIRRLLHEERYTIAGARKRLRELGAGRALEESTAQPERAAAGALPEDATDVERFCNAIKSELGSIRDML